MRRRRGARLVPIVTLVLLGLELLVVPRLRPVSPLTAPLPSLEPGATVMLAVGDISFCEGSADEAVATLAAGLPGTIALLGDIAYPHGAAADFATCFRPAWGPMLERIRPAAGNHEYETRDAAPYFAEFGAAAGTPGEGWYSYDLGGWHVIVLNSNCEFVGGCGSGSPQLAWLAADLEAHPVACTLAYWHHPRYSSGRHGDHERVAPLWDALAAAGADVILEGHDHDYERLGAIDGMRSFVVGTGGRSLYELLRFPNPASELLSNDSYGLLLLALRDDGYDWRFVPAEGSTLIDAGTDACH